MTEVFSWIVSNWGTIGAIVFGALSLASLVTALTPTPADDEFVRKLMGWLSFLQPRDSAGSVKAPLTKPAGPAEDPIVTARPADAKEDPSEGPRFL
jgi:hypothetical protein